MLAGKGERNLLEELAILINLSCPSCVNGKHHSRGWIKTGATPTNIEEHHNKLEATKPSTLADLGDHSRVHWKKMLSGRNHMLCKCCTVTLQVTRGLAVISQCQSPAASSLPHSPQCPEEPSVPHSKLLVGQNCLAEHAAHRCQQAGTAHRPSAQARPGASAPTQSTHNDSRCEKATNMHRLYSTPVVSYLGVAFEPL